MSGTPRLITISLLSALVGGGVVAGAVAAAGGFSEKVRTETRIESALAPAGKADVASEKGALTAHQIYLKDGPGVVFVSATVVHRAETPFELFRGEGSSRAVDTGSGIVLNKQGLILTNWHVVANAVKVTVSFSEQAKAITAQVVGKDPSKDLALLRIPTEGVTLDPLPLGDSSVVQVGEPVFAIGNPFDLQRTLTNGIVSALQRQITAPNGFAITNVIQTDAAINPGNSGGPLLNDRGEVIGINSQIETAGTAGNIGIGFAIPINTAKEVLPSLEKGGNVQEAYLGVSTTTIDGSLTIPGVSFPVKEGALVEAVFKESPAQKAGVKGGDVEAVVGGERITLGGDLIVGVDGTPVHSSEDLANAILSHRPGDTVTVELYAPTSNGHYGPKQDVKVTLGSRPSAKPTPQEAREAGEGQLPEEGEG